MPALSRAVRSYKDLDEYNASTDRLVFGDNEGLSFGAGIDLDIYSDGSSGILSVLNPSKQHATLDTDRFAIKFGGVAIVSGLASAPTVEWNAGHPVLAGYAAMKHVLYLLGTESSSLEPQLVFADTSAPATNVFFGYTQSTRLLSLEGDGSGNFSLGYSGDDVSIMGVTPVGQYTHLADPAADTSALATWAANINTRLEGLGLNAAA